MDYERVFITFAVNICSFKIMSPRITRLRKVLNPPVIAGFKPYGPETGKPDAEPVFLLYEEYEALRLCDYDKYNHFQASELMGVSRPTFSRIYSSSRQKLATCFVEGRQIIIEGGKVYFDSDWYHCKKCKCYFNNPEKEKEIKLCPLCRSRQVSSFDYDNSDSETVSTPTDRYCICPECGIQQAHQPGIPCAHQLCPNCNTLMKRKGTPGCRTLKPQII